MDEWILQLALPIKAYQPKYRTPPNFKQDTQVWNFLGLYSNIHVQLYY